jgi:hypothetical protein
MSGNSDTKPAGSGGGSSNSGGTRSPQGSARPTPVDNLISTVFRGGETPPGKQVTKDSSPDLTPKRGEGGSGS